MKKIISLLLVCALIFTGCSSSNNSEDTSLATNKVVSKHVVITNVEPLENNVMGCPNIPETKDDMEENIYISLIENLDSENYLVEDVQVIYRSKEYLEAAEYNNKENVYFGYTDSELDAMFEGENYVFDLDENGKTTVKLAEEYDDSFDKMIKNVAIGTGVILVCVTVSVLTAGTSTTAISVIFAASAKSGAIVGASSAGIGALTAGIVTGVETKDFDETVKAMALSASKGYKWGAITGVATGGISKYAQLKTASAGGLTLNQVAMIQKESKYPVEIIKKFASVEQYNVCKNAGLVCKTVNGKSALVRNIDLNYVDDLTGLTNLQLMAKGNAPIDPATGFKYELHHMGQKIDSPLAILTQGEHRLNGNSTLWHTETASDVHKITNNWQAQKQEFWKDMAKILTEGAV